MAATGSAELRDVYEGQYSAGDADAARYGRWRALCAEGKADHVTTLAAALENRPRSLVEVGCGDGSLLEALAARGFADSLHGFDISERAVQIVRGRGVAQRVERFDGTSLRAAADAYDLGVLSHVLEHIPDPAPLLRETARTCRALIVEVPLEDNRSASRPAAQQGREAIGHLHRFSRADVHRLASDAGLQVIGELADPLPLRVHRFWAIGPAARVLASGKAVARRALFTVAPRTAERAFTVHYAALLTARS
ncbi:MAG: class I SAM-dependent methyltransferase [Actinomycetota bacterium]|nr:class I SAM-dependent methyltransferase [Actinomycetota bacterium]